jgi:hypothetical protein
MTGYWTRGWRDIGQEGIRAEDDRLLARRVEGYWPGMEDGRIFLGGQQKIEKEMAEC